jgi:predicted solute-binding protein
MRIGTVGYLNAEPLTCLLDANEHDIQTGVPSQIADWLGRGDVDVALVPVAAALQKDLRIVPNVAIGADGPVTSVLLVGTTPPQQWTRVVLDGASRTSAMLTRVMAAEGKAPFGDVEFVQVPPHTALDCVDQTTGALVIGDLARALPDHIDVRIDLAECWRAWTGLPFVFAVWAGRPNLPTAVVKDLQQAAQVGIAGIAERHEEPDRSYLTVHVRYGLGDRELMGLRRFAALAHRHGFLPHPEVSLYAPQGHIDRGGVRQLIDRALVGELTAEESASLAEFAPLHLLGMAASKKATLSKTLHTTWTMLPLDGAYSHWVKAIGGVETSVAVLPETKGRRADGNTAVDQLRATALARLLLPPEVRVLAPASPLAVTQAALRMGADGIAGELTDELRRHIEAAGVTLA